MDLTNEQNDRHPCPQRPMGLGEVFLAGLRLTGSTLVRSGLFALILLIPLFLVFGEVARAFFIDGAGVLAEAARGGPDVAPDEFSSAMASLAGSSLLLNLVLLFLLVGFVLAQTAVTVDSWDRALGERRPWSGWLMRSVGRPFWSGLVQILIMLSLFLLTTLAALLINASIGETAGPGGSTAVWIAYLAGAIFLAVATIFRVHEIVADDRGPWHGLIASIALVRGNWLKAFTVVVAIVLIYEALSMLSSAVLFGSSEVAIPVTADLQNAQTVAVAWGAIGRMLTPAFMGVTALIAFLSLWVGTNMVTALYVDLRARRGDFDPDEDSAEVQEFEGYGR